jgi:uncharacterized protein (DUF2132 family)
MIEQQQNNPLHGVNLETLLTELVEFYGWDILTTAMRFNCFKTNPTIKGSLKFLKNTDWAREKLEGFYLYRFKRMPKPDSDQYDLPPRERGFRDGIEPREPMLLSHESIALSQAKAASAFKAKTSENPKQTFQSYNRSSCDKGRCTPRSKPEKSGPSDDPSDPWGLKNK